MKEKFIMGKKKQEPEPDKLFQFHCLQNKKNGRFYECQMIPSKNTNKVINMETKEIENYQSPTQILAYEANQSKREQSNSLQKSANTVSTVVIASLIGAFGLAIAYYLMNVLYQWTVEPEGQFLNQFRIWVSIIVLSSLMFGFVIMTYYLFKKRLVHNEQDGNEAIVRQVKNQQYFTPSPPSSNK